MSKKSKNNVNTDEVIEEVKAEESVVTNEEATGGVVEEKADDVVETVPAEGETKEEEQPVVEKEEEVVASVVAEKPAPDVAKAVEVKDDENIEGPVDYFVQLNKEPFSDEKLVMVEERLDKYSLTRIISAEGIVLVGPYVTREGAINGRRLVIRCGLKGDIVEIPKNK